MCRICKNRLNNKKCLCLRLKDDFHKEKKNRQYFVYLPFHYYINCVLSNV